MRPWLFKVHSLAGLVCAGLVDCEAKTQTGTPSFRDAVRFWLKLGFISFGGPAGQIAIMHTELVEKKKWIEEGRFLHALNFCMLLPGPEATQLAVYCGWLLHKTWGGVVAGVLFILPSVFLLWGLAYVYAAYGHVGWIAGIFYGLKPAVTALVLSAVLRIGRRSLKTPTMWAVAGAAFVAIYFLRAPFPVIVGAAAILGFFGGKFAPRQFPQAAAHGSAGVHATRESEVDPETTQPSSRRAAKVLIVCLLLWFTPVVLAALWQGPNGTLVREGIFFSKAAMVTFGGAYAVLPYVGQQAVDHYAWLTAPQMVDGLGLAETTPGPLIMVVQFVGFLGAWNHPGSLSPALSGALGALMTTWTTFVPCFLWILLGAPYIEQARGNVRLSSALATVTASVVGVILNLSVWFAINVFAPLPGVIDWFAIALTLVSFTALQRFKVGMIPVVLICGGIGLTYRLFM